MSETSGFNGEARARIRRAVRRVEAGDAGRAGASGGATQPPTTVRVTDGTPDGGGLYEAVVTRWDRASADWEDHGSCRLKPANGQTLTEDTRYDANPAGLTAGGHLLFVTTDGTAAGSIGYTDYTHDGIISLVPQVIGAGVKEFIQGVVTDQIYFGYHADAENLPSGLTAVGDCVGIVSFGSRGYDFNSVRIEVYNGVKNNGGILDISDTGDRGLFLFQSAKSTGSGNLRPELGIINDLGDTEIGETDTDAIGNRYVSGLMVAKGTITEINGGTF